MQFRFSSRTNWNTAESGYAKTLREARLAGKMLYDLTASNPTTCSLDYAVPAILAPLSTPAALTYEPDPRGLLRAREAVAAYYAAHGATIAADALQLTTSTSEAYSYLFRLLCNPGDEVLVAQPSYPLFDFLADLDDVRLRPFSLFYDHGWCVDFDSLERAITPRTRALMVVHPNNPTGHLTSAPERFRMEQLCQQHGLALIVDEVFLDYSLEEEAARSFACGEHPVVTFVLSGMSKIAALPQMKVGWIASTGPQEQLQEALARLEVIADTFLSLNAPVQHALPQWLAHRQGVQQQIRQRTRSNLLFLDQNLSGKSQVSRLQAQAGWSVVLRVPALTEDEDMVRQLVEEQGVVCHPGSFYGFPRQGWLVLSLLSPEAEFQEGVLRILRYFEVSTGENRGS